MTAEWWVFGDTVNYLSPLCCLIFTFALVLSELWKRHWKRPVSGSLRNPSGVWSGLNVPNMPSSGKWLQKMTTSLSLGLASNLQIIYIESHWDYMSSQDGNKVKSFEKIFTFGRLHFTSGAWSFNFKLWLWGGVLWCDFSSLEHEAASDEVHTCITYFTDISPLSLKYLVLLLPLYSPSLLIPLSLSSTRMLDCYDGNLMVSPLCTLPQWNPKCKYLHHRRFSLKMLEKASIQRAKK